MVYKNIDKKMRIKIAILSPFSLLMKNLYTPISNYHRKKMLVSIFLFFSVIIFLFLYKK
ncbi:hypothetical protein [uncultured Gammaproteobacteria bacterium]|nr:hypothetical protein [uncultured Gammaproteobacteria bacterium]